MAPQPSDVLFVTSPPVLSETVLRVFGPPREGADADGRPSDYYEVAVERGASCSPREREGSVAMGGVAACRDE
jgi:hypothetical protein